VGEIPGELQTLGYEAVPPRQVYRRREPSPLTLLVGDHEQDVGAFIAPSRAATLQVFHVDSLLPPAPETGSWTVVATVTSEVVDRLSRTLVSVPIGQDAGVIKLQAVGDRFVASVSPPHSKEGWASPGPLTATEVLRELSRLGCHSTDITDALDGTGQDWRPAHDAEVKRQRSD
jgi:hypothetical protein